jgi:hypothetical protein
VVAIGANRGPAAGAAEQHTTTTVRDRTALGVHVLAGERQTRTLPAVAFRVIEVEATNGAARALLESGIGQARVAGGEDLPATELIRRRRPAATAKTEQTQHEYRC